jgi:60 kDa SS-A/Ro ribonucleoprotein
MGNDATRAAALKAVREVCRIPTDLFGFAENLQALGGWGRGKRNAIARWYTEADLDKLAYQVVKYRQRNGWTHRDLLRLSHPKTSEQGRQNLFNWIAKQGEVKRTERKAMPKIIAAFEKAQKTDDARVLLTLIKEHKLSWEMLPTEALNNPKIWPTLLENMPMQAMVRMLGRMTANGTLTQFGDQTKLVVERLGNADLIKKSGIHPMKLLIAQRAYAAGHGQKGSLTWSPIPQISDALEEAFYASFGLIEPTGKRFMLGLDVSGSMGCPMGDSGITCAEGTAVMAMVTARLEKNSYVHGFAETFNSRFRDEFLNTELFTTVAEAHALADRWRWEYNTLRPHSALQGRTPLEAAQLTAA